MSRNKQHYRNLRNGRWQLSFQYLEKDNKGGPWLHKFLFFLLKKSGGQISRSASSSSISSIFMSSSHNFTTHPHADCTAFSRAVEVEQKARLVSRLELPPYVVSPAARENRGHNEMDKALMTVSHSQKILQDTPAQPNHSEADRLPLPSPCPCWTSPPGCECSGWRCCSQQHVSMAFWSQ